MSDHDRINDAAASDLLAADNGILAKVPGEYIAAAMRVLPQATLDSPQRSVDIEINPPWTLGWVRIWFCVHRPAGVHRRAMRPFWVATRAEQVSAPPTSK